MTVKNNKSNTRCEQCGFRIRGPNHEQGPHHNKDRELTKHGGHGGKKNKR